MILKVTLLTSSLCHNKIVNFLFKCFNSINSLISAKYFIMNGSLASEKESGDEMEIEDYEHKLSARSEELVKLTQQVKDSSYDSCVPTNMTKTLLQQVSKQ